MTFQSAARELIGKYLRRGSANAGEPPTLPASEPMPKQEAWRDSETEQTLNAVAAYVMKHGETEEPQYGGFTGACGAGEEWSSRGKRAAYEDLELRLVEESGSDALWAGFHTLHTTMSSARRLYVLMDGREVLHAHKSTSYSSYRNSTPTSESGEGPWGINYGNAGILERLKLLRATAPQ